MILTISIVGIKIETVKSSLLSPVDRDNNFHDPIANKTFVLIAKNKNNRVLFIIARVSNMISISCDFIVLKIRFRNIPARITYNKA